MLGTADRFRRLIGNDGISWKHIMRLKRWVMMLAVIGVCAVAGVYFGRAITSKQSPALPPDLQATFSKPTETSTPVPSPEAPKEVPKVDLPKVADAVSVNADVSRANPGVLNESVPLIEWAIGRTQGDLVPDVTGHGHDARIHGQPLLAPNWGGRLALEFDGQGTNDFWRDHSEFVNFSIAY